jgi:hypothetical protein
MPLVLLLIALVASAHADPSCPVHDPAEDYAKVYSAPAKGSRLQLQKIDLDGDGKPELLVAEESSCGSGGCEYALYQQAGEKCFRRIAEFIGHFQALEARHNGFARLLITQKIEGKPLELQEIFLFDPARGSYAPDPTRRRVVER